MFMVPSLTRPAMCDFPSSGLRPGCQKSGGSRAETHETKIKDQTGSVCCARSVLLEQEGMLRFLDSIFTDMLNWTVNQSIKNEREYQWINF